MSFDNFTAALTNHRRSLLQLAIALLRAADRTPDGAPSCSTEVEHELVDGQLAIDEQTIHEVIIAMVALEAVRKDTTPRSLLEQHFNDAPTDDWWREHINRPTRGET